MRKIGSTVFYFFPHFLASIMILYALYQGITVSKDLTWPCEIDMMRNVAQAQGILDGHPFDDPTYYREKIWYNPLVHFIVAGSCKLTGEPANMVFQRGGAYLNILVPIVFYIFLAYFFNSYVALAGILGMLFLFNNNLPTCSSGTYTPILYTSHFAPILFFISLMFYFKAVSSDRKIFYFLAGIFTGFSFLAHTAPAVILGAVVIFVTIVKMFKSKGQSLQESLMPLKGFLILAATAAIVSLPLLYSMLFHYRLKIKNLQPVDYIINFLRINNFNQFMKLFLPSIFISLILLAGLFDLVKRARKALKAKLVLIFTAVSFVLFLYAYLSQLFSNVLRLPMVIPGFHYLVYLGFSEAILFGLGIVYIADKVSGFILRSKEKGRNEKKDKQGTGIILSIMFVVAISVTAFIISYNEYLSRQDFTTLKHPSCRNINMSDYEPVHNWIITNVPPEGVFLNDVNISGSFLMTARKFVVNPVTVFLSNPFVDYKKRLRDRDLMLLSLERKRYGALNKLLFDYSVDYVLTSKGNWADRWGKPVFLVPVFKSVSNEIYRVNYAELEKFVKMEPPLVEPYFALTDDLLFYDVVVYGITPRQFDYFDQEQVADVLKNWKWIKEQENDEAVMKLFRNMRKSTVIITSRKILMLFLSSSSIDEIKRSELLFCPFNLPRQYLKIKNRYPEKVIIFKAGGNAYKKLSEFSRLTFKMTDAYNLDKMPFTDESEFIQAACRFVFNCNMKQKYISYRVKKIKNGESSRRDVIDSLMMQASKIQY